MSSGCAAIWQRAEAGGLGLPRAFTFYVAFALANYHEPTCRKALSEAGAAGA